MLKLTFSPVQKKKLMFSQETSSVFMIVGKDSIASDENHEIGQIQAKGQSGEGRRPKWIR